MASDVLSAKLPKRWGVLQRTKNTCIYGLVRAGFAFLRWMPRFCTAPLFWVLGGIAPWVARKDWHTTCRQLSHAFPDWEANQVRRTARQVFAHFARCAHDAVHLRSTLSAKSFPTLSDEQRQLFENALKERRGVIAITGHIGNWELLAQVLAKEQFPIHTIAKPLYDPRLTRWVHQQRTQYGMDVIWRGDKDNSKAIMQVLKSGEILALLIDQDTRVQGEFVPFFGRPAHTPTAAGALALKFGCPIIIGWHQYTAKGAHTLHFERFEVDPKLSQDPVAITAALTLRLEKIIKMAPEQWVWFHRRWKKEPPSA